MRMPRWHLLLQPKSRAVRPDAQPHSVRTGSQLCSVRLHSMRPPWFFVVPKSTSCAVSHPSRRVVLCSVRLHSMRPPSRRVRLRPRAACWPRSVLSLSRVGQTSSTKGRPPWYFVLRLVSQALWALPVLELPPGREPAVLWIEVEVQTASQAPPTPVEVAPGHGQEDAREIPNLGNPKPLRTKLGGTLGCGICLPTLNHSLGKEKSRTHCVMKFTSDIQCTTFTAYN